MTTKLGCNQKESKNAVYLYLIIHFVYLIHFILLFNEGLNGGYLDNTKHIIFWLCNLKQLNFWHFNTNSKKVFETVNFYKKEAKTAPKRPILFYLVYQGVFGHFTTILDYFRRFPKTKKEVRPLPKMSEEPTKHFTVFSSETVNIKKLQTLFNSVRKLMTFYYT